MTVLSSSIQPEFKLPTCWTPCRPWGYKDEKNWVYSLVRQTGNDWPEFNSIEALSMFINSLEVQSCKQSFVFCFCCIFLLGFVLWDCNLWRWLSDDMARAMPLKGYYYLQFPREGDTPCHARPQWKHQVLVRRQTQVQGEGLGWSLY